MFLFIFILEFLETVFRTRKVARILFCQFGLKVEALYNMAIVKKKSFLISLC